MVNVIPSPTTGWRVETRPVEQPFLFPTKSQAMLFALAWAENHQPNEIRVYGNAGELERNITFPNGNQRRDAGFDRRKAHVSIQFPDRRRAERRAKA